MKTLQSLLVALLISAVGVAPVNAQAISSGGGGITTIPTVLTDHIFTEKPLSATSDSSLTPNLTTAQAYAETALANAITINAPVNATHFPQQLFFYFVDTGTPRAITWNAAFLGSPSNTTVASTKLFVSFALDVDGTHWNLLADSGAGGISGVTTSGSPTTNALALFTGGSVITSGNLSGDCTTSNTLAVTCSGLAPKASPSFTGKAAFVSTHGTVVSDSDGSTITFDLSAGDTHTVTLGASRTLALSNHSVGQYFTIILVQGGSGSNTVTWFTTIKWAGGTAPTLTTTNGKADMFTCLEYSSGNYYCSVAGQAF